VRVRDEDDAAAMEAEDRRRHEQQASQMAFQHPGVGNQGPDEELAEMGVVGLNGPKVGRNDPCPCGSGKKFKQCHGRLG